MTGAPIPDGADAVVQVERTRLLDDRTVYLEQVDPAPGQNLLPLGASLRVGDVVLCEGSELRPIEIGVLAEIGHGEVLAIPRPRVAVLPTGDELVDVSETPAPAQIRNSNGPLLSAAVAKAGGQPLEQEVARDDRELLRSAIERGLDADILILSGGVSAGKFDLVPEVLSELGVEPVFHKVALRPGKPLWFGVKRDGDRRVLVFGLPGNPVSSFVCFELFARPAISALAGRGFRGLPVRRGRLTHEFRHQGDREAYLPARLTTSVAGSETDLEILPWQGSADLATLARANCLARLSGERQEFVPGAEVEAVLI
jgi:molybdopterin molybdotransferase